MSNMDREDLVVDLSNYAYVDSCPVSSLFHTAEVRIGTDCLLMECQMQIVLHEIVLSEKITLLVEMTFKYSQMCIQHAYTIARMNQ